MTASIHINKGSSRPQLLAYDVVGLYSWVFVWSFFLLKSLLLFSQPVMSLLKYNFYAVQFTHFINILCSNFSYKSIQLCNPHHNLDLKLPITLRHSLPRFVLNSGSHKSLLLVPHHHPSAFYRLAFSRNSTYILIYVVFVSGYFHSAQHFCWFLHVVHL